ncbi:MAG: pseudouridine-5'-phosphate glycosidase [Caldilineales bacterium]|nr:pseudouridine-5'-phosphate glycosidase [Caldilineales bacterium]
MHISAVALESTVIAHGLPYPRNVETALRLEAIIRAGGATPRTCGFVAGEPVAGLDAGQIEQFARGHTPRGPVIKASLRDIGIVAARGLDAATTVATTMWVAHRYGIEVFATGGLGGVHRGEDFDESADLTALATIPVLVVCAGAKAILDLPRTRERLETLGVPVIGFGCDELPAFYTRTSGLAVDARCDTPAQVADIWRAHRQLGLRAGMLVAAPVPADHALDADLADSAIAAALQAAAQNRIRGKALTPFLLDQIAAATGEASLRANLALLQNNAAIAAQIAVALRSSAA